MASNSLRKKLHTKEKIGIKFRKVNILLFTLMATGMICSMLLLINNVTTTASRDFVQLHSTKVIGILNSQLGRELALMTKTVRSPAILEWFADEANNEKRLKAFEEMKNTLEVMQGGSFYLALEESQNEYALNQGDSYEILAPYASLSANNPNDAWYFECVKAEHDYVLNIDIEKFGGRKRLWLNYKVMKGDKLLGVLAAGLLFDEVLENLFGEYDKKSVRTFIIDEHGTLQMDSALKGDENLLIYEKNIYIHDIIENEMFQTWIASYLQTNNVHTPLQELDTLKFSGAEYQHASATQIAGTHWSVVCLYNSDALFKLRNMWPLLLVILGVFIAYTIATSVLTRRMLLQPIHRLVKSLAKDGPVEQGVNVFGLKRNDEFGTLARTIQGMLDSLEANAAQLREASKKSEAASKAKTAFLASMSHEIRTPINAIVGMTLIGKKTVDVARKEDCFEKIESASNHLLGVINDILDISKIEADKLELSFVWFELEKMLQNIINTYVFKMVEKNIDFSISFDLNLPTMIENDDQRLAQVIINLLSNAIKFTPEGGRVHLAIALEDIVDELYVIAITVTDTGVGIAPENQERLFRAFEQAESGTSRTYGGTGLGLAISKHIIEAMNGNIGVDSVPGNGASFHFSISTRAKCEPRKLPAPKNGNTAVLAVDADKHILAFFQAMAAHFHFECDTAQSLDEGIMLAKSHKHYALCFLDRKTLDENSRENAAQITGLQNGADDIIFMTNFAQDNADCENEKIIPQKVLIKPFLPSTLLGYIFPEHTESTAPAPTDAGCFAGKVILLAEDVELNREIFCALLEHTEAEIVCAENGFAAVETFTANPAKYDIIMMDVQMPGMDGYTATEAIRNLAAPQATSVPIIALTANVFREDIERSLASGMNSHLGKPLDYEMLMTTLHSYLTK